MILSNNSSNYSNNISLKCDLFYKRLHYSTYVSVLRLKMVGVIYATYNWIMVIVNYEHCVIDINIKFIKHNRYYIYIFFYIYKIISYNNFTLTRYWKKTCIYMLFKKKLI